MLHGFNFSCSTQYIILNVRTVCDVIIARSCGTLPASAAIMFLLTWECVISCTYVYV